MSQNCVLKGTLILLEDGKTKEIENLKVGEKLLSYSVKGIENSQEESILGKTQVSEFEGEFSYQLIKNIWKNTFDQYYKINNKLMITEDHFIICKRNDNYFWIQIENLRIGDSLFKSDNTFEKIDTIQLIEETQTVYNIQVNFVYSFFADGYLVHNGKGGSFNCNSTYCSDCYTAFSGGGGGM